MFFSVSSLVHGRSRCERHEITVSANNGLHVCMVGTLPAYAVFRPGKLKNQSVRNLFFDILTMFYAVFMCFFNLFG